MLIVIDGETEKERFNHWRCVFPTVMIIKKERCFMKKIKQKGTIASSLWTLWVLYICILCTIYLFH